jgi:hypothetical protein
VFGIFQKKTRQEQQQFPEPNVSPNFDPHHIFTKEEEDHLDALLVSFQNDLITNASKDAPTTTNNNRSNIDYYVNTPATPLPLLSLNDESPISSSVKDYSRSVPREAVYTSWNYGNGLILIGNKPTHMNVLSAISIPEPADASTSFLKSIFEPSNEAVGYFCCGRAKNIDSKRTDFCHDVWNKQEPSHSKHRADTLESIFDNLKQNQPSNLFQRTGSKPFIGITTMSKSSNDVPLHIQENSRLTLEKINWERMHSSSSRVNKSTTTSSFRDTYTHTSSSSSSSSCSSSSSSSRSTFHGDDSTKLMQHSSSILSKQIGGKYHQKSVGSCSSSTSSSNISLSSSDESLAIMNNKCSKATSILPPVSSNEKKSTSGWSKFSKKKNGGSSSSEKKSDVGWGNSSEQKNGGGWGTSSEKKSGGGWSISWEKKNGGGWGTSSKNKSGGGWGASSENMSGGGWGNSSEQKNGGGWGSSSEKKSSGSWSTSSEKKSGGWGTSSGKNNGGGWSTSSEKKSDGGWGTSSENKSGRGWGTSSEKKSAGSWGQTRKWSDNDAVFGAWEKHTKGIGSKLLRKMGYRGGRQFVLPPINKENFGIGYREE